MKRGTVKSLAIVATMGLVWTVGELSGVPKFAAEGFKLDTHAVGASAEVFNMNVETTDKTALMEQIKLQADKLNEKPIDAVLDRVWKAIPGYNGREVDIEATYLKTAQQERDVLGSSSEPIAWVFRETKPATSLADLGPQPIYRGNPKKPMAAIMINVAWGNEYLEPMLGTLDKEGVKATFFLDGSWLKKYPELAKEIQKRGHEIENHAYSHPNMSQLNTERATLEIVKTKELLKSTLAINNTWFAPPSGDYNQRTVEIAANQGLKTVLWTVDTVDWKNPDPAAVIAKIASKAGPGSLILMHPTPSSKASLQGIIRTLKQKGLKVGTVEETLSPGRIQNTDG